METQNPPPLDRGGLPSERRSLCSEGTTDVPDVPVLGDESPRSDTNTRDEEEINQDKNV